MCRCVCVCVYVCVCVCVCVRQGLAGELFCAGRCCGRSWQPSRRPLEIRERWDEGQPGATPSSHDRRGHCSLCVVEVPSLGLLLGRDFGGVISFFPRTARGPPRCCAGRCREKVRPPVCRRFCHRNCFGTQTFLFSGGSRGWPEVGTETGPQSAAQESRAPDIATAWLFSLAALSTSSPRPRRRGKGRSGAHATNGAASAWSKSAATVTSRVSQTLWGLTGALLSQRPGLACPFARPALSAGVARVSAVAAKEESQSLVADRPKAHVAVRRRRTSIPSLLLHCHHVLQRLGHHAFHPLVPGLDHSSAPELGDNGANAFRPLRTATARTAKSTIWPFRTIAKASQRGHQDKDEDDEERVPDGDGGDNDEQSLMQVLTVTSKKLRAMSRATVQERTQSSSRVMWQLLVFKGSSNNRIFSSSCDRLVMAFILWRSPCPVRCTK